MAKRFSTSERLKHDLMEFNELKFKHAREWHKDCQEATTNTGQFCANILMSSGTMNPEQDFIRLISANAQLFMVGKLSGFACRAL